MASGAVSGEVVQSISVILVRKLVYMVNDEPFSRFRWTFRSEKKRADDGCKTQQSSAPTTA